MDKILCEFSFGASGDLVGRDDFSEFKPVFTLVGSFPMSFAEDFMIAFADRVFSLYDQVCSEYSVASEFCLLEDDQLLAARVRRYLDIYGCERFNELINNQEVSE